jgi:hypothetical protein
MYKSAQELEQEAMTRIERIYAEAETIGLWKHQHTLLRQCTAALLRKLADYLDLSTTSQARVVTKVKQ